MEMNWAVPVQPAFGDEMLQSQKLALRASEIRTRLAALAAIESQTDEQRSELGNLRTEYSDIETRYQAALISEDKPPEHRQETPEGRELRAMIEGANLGHIFNAVLEHRQTDGAEAELQQHYGLAANAVPLEMLRLETRAFTPAPTDTGASQQPILQPVFATGDAAFLGVSMPTVPVGDAVYPVLTTRPTVGGPHKDSTAVAETTGAFTAEVLEPSRLQASFFYRRTDAARFAGMGEALRQALNAGLSEALDKEVIDQIVTDVARTDATAADTFATYRSRLVYGQLDGRFASMESDMRLLAGASTVTHMAAAYRGNTADDSALDSLRRVAGGVRVSAHIAAVAANKQDVIVRRGLRADATAPLWAGATLIPDEVTKAGTGEIVITAVLMAAFKVIRTDGFARVQSQHA